MEAEIIASRDIQQYNETIPLDHIAISGKNPREKIEDDEEFHGLMLDLAANGLINPILVRPVGNPDSSRYEIVCGHRRFEAATRLGWPSIRCTVRAMTDDEAFELMGIENIKRQDLAPIEEARWVQQAWKNAEAKGEKQGDFAKRIGKTQSWVSNKIRVLNAPKEVLDLYVQGRIGDKHVLTLLRYRTYPGLFGEIMEYLTDGLSNGRSVSASQIESDAKVLIRIGGRERYALCLDPFPYEYRDLMPLFFREGNCKGRDCVDVELIEVEGTQRPYCLNQGCWKACIDAAGILAQSDRMKEANQATSTDQAARDKAWIEECKAIEQEQDAARCADEEKEIDAQEKKDLAESYAKGQQAGREEIDRIRDEWTDEKVEEYIKNLEGLIEKEKANRNQDKRRRNYISLVEGQLYEVRTWHEGKRGKVQKCHVASCTNDTLPGKFWCQEHLTAEQRREDPEVETQAPDLPVNELPAPTAYVCRICGKKLKMLDKAGATSDMIEHLFENSEKARHNKAIQKFISGLLDGKGIEELLRFYEAVRPEASKPKGTPKKVPEVKTEDGDYYECKPKDRGVMAKSKDQARAMLECEKCKNRKCQGPEVDL